MERVHLEERSSPPSGWSRPHSERRLIRTQSDEGHMSETDKITRASEERWRNFSTKQLCPSRLKVTCNTSHRNPSAVFGFLSLGHCSYKSLPFCWSCFISESRSIVLCCLHSETHLEFYVDNSVYKSLRFLLINGACHIWQGNISVIRHFQIFFQDATPPAVFVTEP